MPSELDPQNLTIAYTVAGFYFATRNYEQTRMALERVLALKPDHMAARLDLGGELEMHERGQTGRWHAAIEKILAADPAAAEDEVMKSARFTCALYERDFAAAEGAAAALPEKSLEDGRDKGRSNIRQRIAALQQAVTLDPHDTTHLDILQRTLCSVRNWPEALRVAGRIQALLPPGNAEIDWGRAWEELFMTGVMDPLKKRIAVAPAGDPDRLMSRYFVAMLERDYPAADRDLRETPAALFGRDFTHSKVMQEALLTVARGAGPAAAERALLAAREESEKLLVDSPDSYAIYGNLGLIDAFLGRKEHAIREGRRWVELENYSILEKNDASAMLALIYARTGQTEEVINLIERLLTAPANLAQWWVFSMRQTDLKWRWEWDPLRNNPRFQKILASPEPKTITEQSYRLPAL